MTNEEFMVVVDEVVVKCKKILAKKGPNYSTMDDRFHNFKAAAGLQSSTPKQALFAMAAKHLVAINDYIDDDADGLIVTRKEWEAKVLDGINYLFLLSGMLVEEEKM